MRKIMRWEPGTALRLWGPVLILLLLIFVASAQPKLDVPEDEGWWIYFSGWMPFFADPWEAIIKKSGHLIGFGLLAALSLRAFAGSGLPTRRALIAALGLTLVYALLDELHQSLVPGRFPSLVDVGIDMLGAAIFLTISHRRHLLRPRQPGQDRRAEHPVQP